MVPEPVRISRVLRETRDTWTFRLDVAARPDGWRFAPGQFNMLYVFGTGEVPISISGDPARPGELVHTVRAVGTVTGRLCTLRRGDTVGVRGPYGSAWPMEDATGQDIVLIAGGLGLAPLRPAIYHVLSRRDAYGRVAILYGARTPDDLVYRRELERWRGRFDARVLVTVDRASPAWRGRAGVVTALLETLEFDPAATVALLCGPEVMMRFTIRELAARGLPADRVFLSLERNMQCAVGFCGHCLYGPTFVCKGGPVYPLDRIAWLLNRREI
jgi:NAD(P)H-flavin reductase